MKLYIWIFLLFWINLSYVLWVYSENPSLSYYLEFEYNWKKYLNDESIKCKEWEKLNKVFDNLEKYTFLILEKDKIIKSDYFWTWENFNFLRVFSKENNPTNFIMNSVYPYVNDNYVNNKWINVFCEKDDSNYIVWAINLKWKIIKEKSVVMYEKDIPVDTRKWKEISLNKIYIKINPSEFNNLDYLIDWDNIFIWYEQDNWDNTQQLYNFIWNDWKCHMQKFQYYYNKVLNNGESYKEYINNHDFTKFSNWDDINIIIYINPWYYSKKQENICWNSWILDYRII